jgi:hypothetical protein
MITVRENSDETKLKAAKVAASFVVRKRRNQLYRYHDLTTYLSALGLMKDLTWYEKDMDRNNNQAN